MTDFVNLPQDPFQRTTTSFRPYETEPPLLRSIFVSCISV